MNTTVKLYNPAHVEESDKVGKGCLELDGDMVRGDKKF